MTITFAILIFVAALILDNLDFLVLRKCPNCKSVFQPERIDRIDEGPRFAKPGHHRILLKYRCRRCGNEWTAVRQEDQNTG
jgi:hypothetical protein